MRILTVVGARPQFVKAAVLSRALRRTHTEVLLHTGQHYDDGMSGRFFRELELPTPERELGVGSGSHAEQTAAMLTGIERAIVEDRPDWVVVLGDTNSTLAGALAAAKLRVRIAHVEAGLRSFNRDMPEEINRVVVDHLSTALFCPSDVSAKNLAAEGICRGVHVVGDLMADALTEAAPSASQEILDRLNVTPGAYVLATVHRAENTGDARRLRAIAAALAAIDDPVVFPVHPRTRRALEQLAVTMPRVIIAEPVGYLEMVALERNARLILTDSGGVQKEAYWLGVPCITLREETEWTETVAAGWNLLAGTDTDRIVAAVRTFVPPAERPRLYPCGAAERIADVLHE